MSYIISTHRDIDEDEPCWYVTIDSLTGGTRTMLRRSRSFPSPEHAEACAEGMRFGLKCLTEEPITFESRFG